MKYLKYICSLMLGLVFSITGWSQETLSAARSSVSLDAGKNIEAATETSKFVLRTSDNALVSLITIKDFMFSNSLMREHFNENYMESDKFPEASFSGNLINFDLKNVSEAPKQFSAKGKLKIHGEEQQVVFPVFISKNENNYLLTTSFKILLEDYSIKIPKLMFVKIAEEAKVRVEVVLE